MATASTTTATRPPQPPPLRPNLLPFIDMKTLSQSELHALSLTFSTSPSSTNTITPTIDRTIFNESAGSRRQTYARPSHHHHRHRLASTHISKTPSISTTKLPDNPISNNDPDRLQNRTIINFLKNLLSSHPQFQEPDFFVQFDTFNQFTHPINIISNSPPRQALDFRPMGEKKRKRGRKPKVKIFNIEEKEREMGLEIVNKNGVAVDLVELASLEDPYKEELKRRTEGLENEEALLGFFRGLGGQWCSRRRKRKIVDASEFGDALPVGWKLILAIKKKEGRAWVYCRRYVSPAGQQLASCKEVSAHLQSFFRPPDVQESRDHAGADFQQDHGVISESHAGTFEKEEDQTLSNEHSKQVALLEIDNLAEVQIHDLFECHKCRMTFDEKDTYLQHLLSLHQRTTRRYRIGSSVGEGVIVKDGKYECQFCHKVFHERHRYNGHVGIHVRNFVRGVEDSPAVQLALQNRSDSPTQAELPMKISKMDALIEIAQNSIRETSSSRPNDETNCELTSGKQNQVSNSEFLASVSDHELDSSSPLNEPEMEDVIIDRSLGLELHQQKVDFMVTDEMMERIEDASDGLDVKMDSSRDDAQHGSNSETLCRDAVLALGSHEIEMSGTQLGNDSESHSLITLTNQKICAADGNKNLIGTDRAQQHMTDEVDKSMNVEIEIGFESINNVAVCDIIQDTAGLSSKENVLKCEVPESQLQSGLDFSAPHANLDKGKNGFDAIVQRHAEVTEQLHFTLGTGQESLSLQEVPLGMINNAEREAACGASLQFESDIIVDTGGRQQLTTLCVWCGVEFSHEAFDTEMQSDSVGYMCPDCKAKISGQLNM